MLVELWNVTIHSFLLSCLLGLLSLKKPHSERSSLFFTSNHNHIFNLWSTEAVMFRCTLTNGSKKQKRKEKEELSPRSHLSHRLMRFNC